MAKDDVILSDAREAEKWAKEASAAATVVADNLQRHLAHSPQETLSLNDVLLKARSVERWAAEARNSSKRVAKGLQKRLEDSVQRSGDDDKQRPPGSGRP